MNHPRHEMMQTALRKWAFETDPMPAQQPLDFEGDGRQWHTVAATRDTAERSTMRSQWAYDGTIVSWQGQGKP